MDEHATPVRVDIWLWAARFVKTRGLAVEAIDGGRVHVNSQRVKPSKTVHAGDLLEITLGEVRRTVVVQATARRRGPASDAARLYEETVESREARERAAAERRLMRAEAPAVRGPRPTKRDRRRLDESRRGRRGR
jgi:ribosome-associated heat shock protein Hsp15